MNGFYSLWSKPFFSRYKNTDKYYMYDYEILTLLASAAIYQKYNGYCSIYLDADVYKYFNELKILDIFKGHVYELNIDETINPNVFWAAGKIYALKNQKEPFAMIDNDLIIWQNLDRYLENKHIMALHHEYIKDQIYPNPLDFNISNDYKLHFENLVKPFLTILPVNTAFLYCDDIKLISDFSLQSIEFMKNCNETEDYLRPMVFAEQRLLPIIAQNKGINIETFFDYPENIGRQQIFTHLWGHKDILKYNLNERQTYNQRVFNRLKAEDEGIYEIAIKAISINAKY